MESAGSRLSFGIAPPNDVCELLQLDEQSAPRFSKSDDKLPAVPLPRATFRHFARQSSQPGLLNRFIRAPRRRQQRECRRFQPVHFFGHESEAVCEAMGKYFLGHDGGC